MKTYLFYDLETSGLNPSFDQVLQFAAIRTDTELNELNRYEIHCQLRPDIVPHLSAILTHRISPLAAIDSHLPTERDAIHQIHALVNEPGTISVGYNTLGFDDEVLRFSFFRNLLPPYTHQFSNQCSRMDLLPITVFYYLFAPNTLNWPTQDGKVSLKLENLNAQNNWVAGQAHNAMTDVEVSVALAKQLRNNPSMWAFCTGYFDKQQEKQRFSDWSLANKQALWVHHRLGSDQQFIAVVAYLGQHRHYRNQTLFLRLDQVDFREVSDDQWLDAHWVYKKKWGEPGFLLPMKQRFCDGLTAQRYELAQANWAWLQQNPAYWDKLQAYHLDYKYPIEPQADTDSVLYQHGLICEQDQHISQQIHQVDLTTQQQLIDQFTTSELCDLAWRMIARNHHDQLPEQDQNKAQIFFWHQLTDAIIDYRRRPKYNLVQAREDWLKQEADKANLDDEQQQLLADYQQFLHSKEGY